MKKSVAIILTLALLLGAVLYIAPVSAEASGLTLTITLKTTTQSVGDLVVEARADESQASYSKINLHITDITSISTAQWNAIRAIYDAGSDWTNLKELEIDSTSLTTISYTGSPDIYNPKWKTVKLPGSLRTVTGHAFRNSTELETIDINKVSSITGQVFAGCKKLKSITVAQGPGTYLSDNGIIYAAGRRILVIFPPGKEANDEIVPAVTEDGIVTPAVTGFKSIPTATTEFAMHSFTDVSIPALVIPANVTTINDAFVASSPGSSSLTSIYFNRSQPPTLTATTNSQSFNYNNVTAYVPKTTKQAYITRYKSIFGEDNILPSEHPGAELLGVMLRGYVGIGSYDNFNVEDYASISQLIVDGKPYNFQPVINDIDNKYLVDDKGPLPYIDVEAEEIVEASLPDDFTVAAFSVNGEKTWTAGDLNAANAKLTTAFNSASVIVLANAYNSTTRKPAIGSDTITFMRIEGRPNGNTHKLKLYYNDDDKWGFVKAPETNFSSLMNSLFMVQADASGKLPANFDWSAAENLTDEGLDVAGLPPKGTKKTTYFLRNAATATSITTYLPAGRPWKVTPATKSKAPSYKVNYKKEILVLKKGDELTLGETVIASPSSVKTEIDVKEYYGEILTITKAATGKKPASTTLELKIAERADFKVIEIAVSDKGKITTPLKDYEFFNNTTNKWGKLPKITGAAVFPVRVKQNAKVVKNVGITGNAASLAGKIAIEWGTLDNGKSGIVSAVMTPPETPETPGGGDPPDPPDPPSDGS